MFERIREDLKTIFERDPAAHSKLKWLCATPGFMRSSCIAGPTGAICRAGPRLRAG